MIRLRTVTDFEECQAVWRQLMPDTYLSDLWEVRACFHRHFQRPLHFVVAEDKSGPVGLLPLSWIEEHQSYGYFPGEAWEGKTWLEQNRVIARDSRVLNAMLQQVGSRYHLRYLLPSEPAPKVQRIVDEIGYLFDPPVFGYNMDNYFEQFSHKSVKRIKKEVAALEGRGVRYRYNDLTDFDHLIDLNVGRFGSDSYFYDSRFRESFRSLMHFLNDKGWLRLTTVIIEDQIAAVDMGSIYRGIYTLLAGGTNAAFPGVAKLINLHHMHYSCEQQFDRADFLCGNFSWKSLFHLSPRPLYMLSNVPAGMGQMEPVAAVAKAAYGHDYEGLRRAAGV
nr:GNAT family N-acetyltransferase [candidate division Zixibacteria bacterium]